MCRLTYYFKEERSMNIYKKLALFAGGTLFGSAGIKLLSSKDAKNASAWPWSRTG